jgi:hypothetical protein
VAGVSGGVSKCSLLALLSTTSEEGRDFFIGGGEEGCEDLPWRCGVVGVGRRSVVGCDELGEGPPLRSPQEPGKCAARFGVDGIEPVKGGML